MINVPTSTSRSWNLEILGKEVRDAAGDFEFRIVSLRKAQNGNNSGTVKIERLEHAGALNCTRKVLYFVRPVFWERSRLEL